MINNEEIEALRLAIAARFFEAIGLLAARKVRHPATNKLLRGQNSFASIYNLNPGNLYQMRVSGRTLDLAYLHYLVRDFGVSSRWLLTGEGEMFVPTKNTDGQPICV